jgi:hypothetical protein
MIQDIINRIEVKLKEKRMLLDKLRLWGEVKEQGIDADNVLSFGFDPELILESELNRIQLVKPIFNKSNPYGWVEREVGGKQICTPEFYNYVRMKTGEKISLVRPIKNPEFVICD